MERGLRKVLGQKAEFRNHARPSPSRGLETHQGHFESVAWSAPSTYTGPAIGLTRPKSMFESTSTFDWDVICPHIASMSRKSTVSPGAITTAGARALSQLMWLMLAVNSVSFAM